MRILSWLLPISAIFSLLLINLSASSVPSHHHTFIVPIHSFQQCQTVYSVDELASQCALLDAYNAHQVSALPASSSFTRGRRATIDTGVNNDNSVRSSSTNFVTKNVMKYSAQLIGNFNFGSNNKLLIPPTHRAFESNEIKTEESSSKPSLRNDDLLKFMIV